MVSTETTPSPVRAAIPAAVLVLLVAASLPGILVPDRMGGLMDRRGWVVVASTAFVLLGALSALRDRTSAGALILAGLILCWVGDVLGPIDFVSGAVAFLAGHVAFAAAFVRPGVDPRRGRVAGVVLALTGAALLWWLLPHVATWSDRVLVVSYLAVISGMVLCASASRHPGWALGAAAAWMFYVSDIAVARWRFVSPGPENAFFCYPLYYPACTLMALLPLYWAHVRRRMTSLPRS